MLSMSVDGPIFFLILKEKHNFLMLIKTFDVKVLYIPLIRLTKSSLYSLLSLYNKYMLYFIAVLNLLKCLYDFYIFFNNSEKILHHFFLNTVYGLFPNSLQHVIMELYFIDFRHLHFILHISFLNSVYLFLKFCLLVTEYYSNNFSGSFFQFSSSLFNYIYPIFLVVMFSNVVILNFISGSSMKFLFKVAYSLLIFKLLLLI